MISHNLTVLQYSTDRQGPWKLYILDAQGLHSGGVWFEKTPKYPDEEITSQAAYERAKAAFQMELEVRICDGGDMLVFHARDGEVIYPEDPDEIESFWRATGIEHV